MPLREVQNILAGEVKASRVGEISENIEMTSAVESISSLGEQAGLGAFHFATVDHGEEKAVLLPNKPPIEVNYLSEGDAMDIVNTLEGNS